MAPGSERREGETVAGIAWEEGPSSPWEPCGEGAARGTAPREAGEEDEGEGHPGAWELPGAWQTWVSPFLEPEASASS